MERVLLSAIGILSLAACGGTDALHGTKPKLKLGMEALDFGPVPAGAKKILEVPVSNTGDATLNLCVSVDAKERCQHASEIVPSNGVFTLVFDDVDPRTGKWAVAVGQNGRQARTFALEFSPPAKTPFQATLDLSDDEASLPSTYMIDGTGIEPEVSFSPEMLDFGPVMLGESRQAKITIRNNGDFDQPFEIAPLSIDLQKVIKVSAPAVVPAKGEVTAAVSYTPVAVHEVTVSLDISYCPGCTKAIGVHGIGADPAFGGGGSGAQQEPDRTHNPDNSHNPPPTHKPT